MRRSSRIESTALHDSQLARNENKALMKSISSILKKEVSSRSRDELEFLQKYAETVNFICKRRTNNKLVKEREQEVEDAASVLEAKCKKLASVIEESRSLIIYSGAGISTAASIPDYRGPQGVWTLLKQGKECRTTDLSLAEPTFTHMAIAELYKRGYVKRVVSQNCDGLHLRSGLPRHVLSELHGNMFLEVCRTCQPMKEYFRLFDVTERTSIRRHKTGRMCYMCNSPLQDTIVHFGEKSPFQSPHNWQQAANAANRADVILCLGSSLKVLKKYACLWANHRAPADQPKLIIVNLQWTPKDKKADLKINGRCDDVMKLIMTFLNLQVAPYQRFSDLLFHLAVPLKPSEEETTSKTILAVPDDFVKMSPEELKFSVPRRKPIVRRSSLQVDDYDEESMGIDQNFLKDELENAMKFYFQNDETNSLIRKQPVRVAKVKQYLMRAKRKSAKEQPDKYTNHLGDDYDNVDDASAILSATLSNDSTPDFIEDFPILSNNQKSGELSRTSTEASLTISTISSDEVVQFDSRSQCSLESASDSSISCIIDVKLTPFDSPSCFLTAPLACGDSESFPALHVVESTCDDVIVVIDRTQMLPSDHGYISVEDVEEICEVSSDRSQSSCELMNGDGTCDVTQNEKNSTLTVPGWFGKGVQTRKIKKKKTRKMK